ncbi:hypothetical protein ES707_21856 [subsurface metagenome]
MGVFGRCWICFTGGESSRREDGKVFAAKGVLGNFFVMFVCNSLQIQKFRILDNFRYAPPKKNLDIGAVNWYK